LGRDGWVTGTSGPLRAVSSCRAPGSCTPGAPRTRPLAPGS
jgi:hypothetical protein